jgi:hypothetical protein
MADADFLATALSNLQLTSLSSGVRTRWKNICQSILPFLPQIKGGGEYMHFDHYRIKNILAEIACMRESAVSKEERELVMALEPVEQLLRHYWELMQLTTASRDAYKMLTELVNRL